MDHVPLMLVHPTGQGDEEKGERGQHGAHGRRLSRHWASDFSNDFNPFEFLPHYGVAKGFPFAPLDELLRWGEFLSPAGGNESLSSRAK